MKEFVAILKNELIKIKIERTVCLKVLAEDISKIISERIKTLKSYTISKLKNLNPDLIPASYTFEEYKKDFNALLRSQYIAQTPEMLAFLKERPSALKDFKQENPDLFNDADKA